MIFKKQELTPAEQEAAALKAWADMLLPGGLRFYTGHYVSSNYYHCVWAVREYPPQVDDRQALLAGLAARQGVSIHIYARLLSAAETHKILQGAARRERRNLDAAAGINMQSAKRAEVQLSVLDATMGGISEDGDDLMHCCVLLELRASSEQLLEDLRQDVLLELMRQQITVDRLLLRQREAFLSILPTGHLILGREFERVLPASSVANLYPISYSGKLDGGGFFIGRDKYGTNIVVDPDRRSPDKPNGNILILGNSGMGKSYLMQLLDINFREAGKTVLLLDPEGDLLQLTQAMGGSYVDYAGGGHIINPLEPRIWHDEDDPEQQTDEPEVFARRSVLGQHVAWLRAFFAAYKDLSTEQLDVLELLLIDLYHQWHVADDGIAETYPILADLYQLAAHTLENYQPAINCLFTAELLRSVCLALQSICCGTDSIYFNGKTNLPTNRWICFGLRSLLDAHSLLQSAVLFNILSYMSGAALTAGNTVIGVDELYLFLQHPAAILYIRALAKRVRKRDSNIILASQNIEDFLVPGIRELTKPLFSIPAHQFLFHPGIVDAADYMDALQITEAEFGLIRSCERGTCLYRCGAERFLLCVEAPEYKSAYFGGGR